MSKKTHLKAPLQEEIIMVCVTSQRQCEDLIAMGSRVAETLQAPLAVVSVQPTGSIDPMSGELLEYLMDVARNSGGELLVLYDDNPIPRLIQYAWEHRAKAIVMGRGPGGGPSTVVNALHQSLPEIRIFQPARESGTVEELRQECAQ